MVRICRKFLNGNGRYKLLIDLGITAVELLPAFDFDDTEFLSIDGKPLKKYWGYSPMCHPHSHCSTEPETGYHIRFSLL
jgi:glycogen operon protein